MKRLSLFLCCFLLSAFCLLAGPAHAHTHGVCGPVVGAVHYRPIYYAPAAYYLPQPVLYQPAQIVYQPAPVVYQPQPVPAYTAPAPVQAQAPCIAPVSAADPYVQGYTYTPGVPVVAGFVYRDGCYFNRHGVRFERTAIAAAVRAGRHAALALRRGR